MTISPVTIYRAFGRIQFCALVLINGRLEVLTSEPYQKDTDGGL